MDRRPHGVERMLFSSEHGDFTFTPGAIQGLGTLQKPFDRPATFRVAIDLAEAFLRMTKENPDADHPEPHGPDERRAPSVGGQP